MAESAPHLAAVPTTTADPWEALILRHARAYRRARQSGDWEAMHRAHLGLQKALQGLHDMERRGAM